MSKITGAFLRRPKLYEGENLYSYLLRTATANHYEVFANFKSVLNERMAKFGADDTLPNLSSQEAFRAVESLCGIPTSHLWNATIHRFAQIINLPNEWEGENTSHWGWADSESIRRGCRPPHQVAFCPACLHEKPFFRLVWNLLGVTACLDHQCMLVDSCPGCGSNLTEKDVVACRCPKCGYDLPTADIIDISSDQDSATTQSVLLALYTGTNQEEGWGLPKASFSTLYRLYNGLMHTVQLKGEWDGLHPFPNSEIPKRVKGQPTWAEYNTYTHRLNVTAIKALMDWPNGFFRFLDTCRNDQTSQNISLSLGLGHLYNGWIDREWNTPEFAFVQAVYNQYLLMRLPVLYPGYERTERHARFPELAEKFAYITVAFAAQKLHTTTNPIINLAKRGLIRCINTDAGRAGMFVSRQDIEVLARKWEQAVTLTKTAELMGTNKQTCLALVERGYLEAVRGRSIDGSSIWLITTVSIHALQSKLESLTERVNREDYVPFPKLVQQMANWNVAAADVLESLIDGEIVPVLAPNTVPMLSNLRFSPNAHHCLKEAIIQKNHWVSLDQFARKMRVKPLIVRRWIQSKLVSCIQVGPKTRFFTRENVKNFQMNYLTSQQAADIIGVGVLTVQKWARLGRLHPVSGEDVDGCHEYRFARSEIVSLSTEKRMTAPQLARQLGISRTQMSVWIRQGKVNPISGPGIDGAKHYLFAAQ